MKKLIFLTVYVLQITISRSELIYSNFQGSFTPTNFDWRIYQMDSHGYSVINCGFTNIVIMNECLNYAFNSLTTKTFELPSHDLVNLQFKLWIITRSNYQFYLYVDNKLQLLIQTSEYSLTNNCPPYGSYEISKNIVHSSSSVQITMVSDWNQWGFSEFNLNVENTTQNFWELVYQSLNKKAFSSISFNDGWMSNNIVSQQIQLCTDFNYLKSPGNNFIKDLTLKNHMMINLSLKVLIFNKTWSTIDIKIDDKLVVTQISNLQVLSSVIICNNFTVISVEISNFAHNNENLRIEVVTAVDGTTSWFGIRDFSLFIDKEEFYYQCNDFNIQPFDGCFSNQYDCNFGCSNCVKGICINCLDGWYLHTKNTCIPICGDNMLMLNEVCDDGNSLPYDGCHNCQFSCPLNCIFCVFGTCQQCEQSYFFIQNRCISDQQISENFVEQIQTGFFENRINYLEKNDFQSENLFEQLETGFFNNWADYLEKNGFQCYQNLVEKLQTGFFNKWTNYLEKSGVQCENLVKQLDAGFFNNWIIQLQKSDFQSENFVEQLETKFFNNWNNFFEIIGFYCQPNYQQQSILKQYQQYNLLQNNYYGLDIVSSFSFCYFSDYQIIQYFQQDSQTECKEDYKFSPNKRQCTQSCNCQDLVSLQNNKCYNCMQNCSLECLMCIQEKCYACLEGWQLVDNKCQQICGDNQVALYSNEQCDDGNQIIEDGCHECQFQCGLFCQFCDKDINCLICDLNFQLINNICQPICGDKIVISGLEECDDGNDIQYDGCFECQFQCSFDCKVCESGKCQDKCKAEEEFLNGQCITKVQTLNQTKDNEPESQQQQELKIVCKNNCLVCDGDLCLECQPDYILEYNKCLSCGNGIINQDEECDDGNRINSDGCSKQCKIEDDWNCIGSFSFISQCFPISKISVLFLNSTLNTQYVKLSYTKEVKLDQQNINFLDFNLNQINIDPTYYNISIFPVIEIVSNETRDINYELKIEINKQLSQNPILDVKVDLILFDENDLPVPPSSSQIVLTAPLVLNQAQVEVSQNFQKLGYNIMLALGSFAIFAFLLGSPQQFLEILDTLQFYSYLKFINVEYPENLQIYFQSSELISVNPILQFLGIKDNFEDQLGGNVIQCFGKFYQYKINADLITNIQSQFMQVIVFFSLFIILKMYLKFCLKFCFIQNLFSFIIQRQSKILEWLAIKLYQINQYAKKQLNFDNIEFIISCYYANAWDLSFKVILYLTFNQQQGIRTIASYVVCLIYLILGILIVLRNFRGQNNKIDIKELRDQQHQLIILLKKLTFVLILIGMQDYSVAQSIMLSFSTCMYIGFITINKFTNTKLEQINILCVEFPVILFTLINLSFCKDFYNLFTPDQIITIAFLQIGCLMLGFLGPLFNCVYQFYNKLKLLYFKIRPNQVIIQLSVKNILQDVKP
ncbi:unnamed protein product [Paramecium octaurelia]|uniref:Insulin-like growth factor binding protein, N-terminal n=1 Tax=Paramecium octaurelia TaxID=43137 RepID=A0A8S1UQR7_PAROT|nr:unnamed protein product [Paramecium octaurelia]